MDGVLPHFQANVPFSMRLNQMTNPSLSQKRTLMWSLRLLRKIKKAPDNSSCGNSLIYKSAEAFKAFPYIDRLLTEEKTSVAWDAQHFSSINKAKQVFRVERSKCLSTCRQMPLHSIAMPVLFCAGSSEKEERFNTFLGRRRFFQ